MTEKDLKIQDLKRKVKQLEESRKATLEYIEKLCVYDEHLQGYCMGLTPGEIKTLVLKLGGNNEKR